MSWRISRKEKQKRKEKIVKQKQQQRQINFKVRRRTSPRGWRNWDFYWENMILGPEQISRERIMGHFKENLPQKRIKFFSWQNRVQFCNDFLNREASNNFWMSWIILNHLNTHHHVNYCLLLLSLSFLRYKYFTFLPDFN